MHARLGRTCIYTRTFGVEVYFTVLIVSCLGYGATAVPTTQYILLKSSISILILIDGSIYSRHVAAPRIRVKVSS